MVDYSTDVDKISDFGPEFQSKLIVSLIRDGSFLAQSLDVLNPNYFDSDGSQWICNKIIEYYSQYRENPTLEYFRAEIDEIKKNDTLKTEILSQLSESSKHSKDRDLKYVQDKFLEFAKNQSLKIAILKSADIIDHGDPSKWGQIKVIMDQAMKAGTQKDLGLIWTEDFDARHLDNPRNTIPTGWAPIDQQLDGGLGPGEIGVFMAPSGAGKSWVLSHVGKVALQLGLNVLHYSYELNQKYVGVRYDACFSGIEPKQLKNHLDDVRGIVQSVDGRLIIKYYPSRTANIHTLLAHMDYLNVQKDFAPNMIIVDYADIMMSAAKAQARHEELGYVYEELRSIAGELQVPIWTASQTQRSSINDDIIEADKVAESYNKVKTADALISISRKTEDKINNTARFHIVKNRFGSDGITFPAKFDASTGFIDVYDPSSNAGSQLMQDMKRGDKATKELLQEKLRKLQQV